MSHEDHASLSSIAIDSATVTPICLSIPMHHRATTASSSAGVAKFCTALDGAFEAAAVVDQPSHCARFVRALRAALARAATDEWPLTPAQREGSCDGYCRHLLAADAAGRYALVALVWQPGQTSPIHAHHTWCGYTVLSGTLTETLYDWNAALGCALPARDQHRTPGAVSYTAAGMSSIHRLHNASTDVAVSLHVYGVSAAQVATHVNNVVRIATPANATSDELRSL
jgi:predicted metal-dependent enzyme (double-stranded beta helix superfamily)